VANRTRRGQQVNLGIQARSPPHCGDRPVIPNKYHLGTSILGGQMCIHNSTFNFKKKLIFCVQAAKKSKTTEKMDAFREAFNLQHFHHFESLDVLEM
jgi:hypothetical protein